MRALVQSGSDKTWSITSDIPTISPPDQSLIKIDDDISIRRAAIPISSSEVTNVQNQKQSANAYYSWKQTVQLNNMLLAQEIFWTRQHFFSPGVVEGFVLSIDTDSLSPTINISPGTAYTKKMESIFQKTIESIDLTTYPNGHLYIQLEASDLVTDSFVAWDTGQSGPNGIQYFYYYFPKIRINTAENENQILIGRVSKSGNGLTFLEGLNSNNVSGVTRISQKALKDTQLTVDPETGEVGIGSTGVSAHDDIQKLSLEWCSNSEIKIQPIEYKFGNATDGNRRSIKYLMDQDGIGIAHDMELGWTIDTNYIGVDFANKVGGKIDNRNYTEGFYAIYAFHNNLEHFEGVGTSKIPIANTNSAIPVNATGLVINLEMQGDSGSDFPGFGFVKEQRVIIYNEFGDWVYALVKQIQGDKQVRIDTANVGSAISANTFAKMVAIDNIRPLVLQSGGPASTYSQKWSILGYFEIDSANEITKVYQPKSESERKNPEKYWIPKNILSNLPEYSRSNNFDYAEYNYAVGTILETPVNKAPIPNCTLMDGKELQRADYKELFDYLGTSHGFGTGTPITGTTTIVRGFNLINGIASQYMLDLEVGMDILFDNGVDPIQIATVSNIISDFQFNINAGITLPSQTGLTIYKLLGFNVPDYDQLHKMALAGGNSGRDLRGRYAINSNANLVYADGSVEEHTHEMGNEDTPHTHTDNGHYHTEDKNSVMGVSSGGAAPLANGYTGDTGIGYADLTTETAEHKHPLSTYGTTVKNTVDTVDVYNWIVTDKGE